MSDDESGSDIESAVMFQCKKCPNKFFTAAEKDIHRQWHKNQQEQERQNKSPEDAPSQRPSRAAKRKPGPKSRVKPRTSSPAPSGVTLFNEVDQNTPSEANNNEDDGAGEQGSPDKEIDSAAAKKKYRSNKKIKKGVVYTKNEGG